MKNTIRNTLLISTATVALIAAAGLASAQSTNESPKAPGAAAQDQKAPAATGTIIMPGARTPKDGAASDGVIKIDQTPSRLDLQNARVLIRRHAEI